MATRQLTVIPPMDLTGKTVGYWYVKGPAPPRYDNKGRPSIKMWDCVCRCGVERQVRDSELRRLGSTSCGCFNREISSTHHATKTRLYEIWHGLKQRCNNPKSKDAHNYGARGIKVCDEWNENFEAFRDWANNNGYLDSLTLDRIDVNGPYSPDNCKWSTIKEQSRNTRVNHLLRFNGEDKTIAEWAEITGIKYYTLANRIYNGWSVERALTQPVQQKKYRNKGEISNGTCV